MEYFNYEGSKVRLRPFKKEDIEQSLIWRNDPEIRDQIMGFRYPVTVEMEEKWLQSFLECKDLNRLGFAIEDLETNKLLGFTFLNEIDYLNRNAKYAVYLGKSTDGNKGIGTECTRMMMNYSFNILNLHRLWVYIRSDNQASINMCIKVGFKKEGELKDHYYINGKYHDITIMGLCRE